MRAIVTGGCGFIGYNLVQILKQTGWEVTVIDDLSSGFIFNHVSNVKYLYQKISQEIVSQCIEELSPEVIFHLAAVPRVSYSVSHPYQTTDLNILSTLSILEAVRKSSSAIRVIFSSSSSVYGNTEILPTPPDAAKQPLSPYALQKLQGEQWCKMYSDLYELDTICLRYFNVFGPHSRWGGAYSTVLSAWLYSLYVDQSVAPFLEGDGSQSRDFCYVDNVCQANILAALSKTDFRGECFNVAQGSAHSLLECKLEIEKISGKKLDLQSRPERVGDVKHTLADISKTTKVLGYMPSTDFGEQLTKMSLWYKDCYTPNH